MAGRKPTGGQRGTSTRANRSSTRASSSDKTGDKTGDKASDKASDKGHGTGADMRGKRGAPLRECVREAIDEYFAHLGGHPCRGLYAMVLAEVEAPLLETVMAQTAGNQRLAAEILGMSRGTLRKKLREYGLIENV